MPTGERSDARIELVLVNLGTPVAPDAAAVRAFLAEFLGDPLVVELPRWLWLPILHGIVLRKRPERVAKLYRSIWTPEGSPLFVATERIARAVERELPSDFVARAAFRYGDPPLAMRILEAMEHCERVVVCALFPQRTASSSGSVERVVESLRARPELRERVVLARLAPDDPGYLAAIASRCGEALRDVAPVEHLLVSFHGIPAGVDRRAGGGYRADCERTASALLARLAWDPSRATLCFQSRFGPARWLEPATDRTLVALAQRGVRRVAVVAPGFLSGGLETLEELGLRGRASFRAAGGEELVLVPAAADHPELARALARCAERALST